MLWDVAVLYTSLLLNLVTSEQNALFYLLSDVIMASQHRARILVG